LFALKSLKLFRNHRTKKQGQINSSDHLRRRTAIIRT